MILEELISYVERFQLGEFGRELISSTKTAIQLRPKHSFESFDNGSRFGGRPFAKNDFAWPLSGNFRGVRRDHEEHQYIVGPLRFICQILVADLPRVPDGLEGEFSDDDLILFFAATNKFYFPDTGCSGRDWQIVVSSRSSGRLHTPPKLPEGFNEAMLDSSSPLYNESVLLPACAIEFVEYAQIDPSLLYGRAEVPNDVDPYSLQKDPLHLLGGYANHRISPVADFAGSKLGVSTLEVSCLAQFESDISLHLSWAGRGVGFFMMATGDPENNILVTH